MYSPRPGYVARSHWLRIVCSAVVMLGFACGGAYVLNYAIEGWNQGAISITKGGRVSTATRAGDHWLLFYVWVTYSLIAGVGLIAVGFCSFITSLPRRADD
jgi:hypothetical protein